MRKSIILENVSAEEMKQFFLDAMYEYYSANHPSKIESTEYLTRKEVAKAFRVSLVTLSDWSKHGKIKSYKIGGRVLYRKDEVEAALIQVEPLKYRRL